MKVAVINFSGNVGKSTIARHLLLPRLPGAKLVSIESINDAEVASESLRGRQFAALQEYLQAVASAVVDIGASNVEDLLALMNRYRGSHEDFDYFVVPTVAAFKQQRDTIATLIELSRMGIPARKLRLVFNMVEDGTSVPEVFQPILTFLAEQPIASVDYACRIGENELYERLKQANADIAAVLSDDTDYKDLISKAKDSSEKVALARRLAVRRLATGAAPELDACFVALALTEPSGSATIRSRL